MINLKYVYNEAIIRNLTEIAAAKEIIENAYILPQWEIKLREQAIILNAHHSTRIEGNTLSFDEVSKLARGRQVLATRKDRMEVLNYLKVLSKIQTYAKHSLNDKLLLRLHSDLTLETLEKREYCGAFRKIQVVVGSRRGGKVLVSFRPPPPQDVPKLVASFFKWLKDESEDLNPVITAGISHYEIVRIHPFVDGNGRTARAFATLLLYRSGFDIKRFFALDDYYDSKREDYYKVLQNVDPQSLDITEWLEYFTFGVRGSVVRVKEKILELSRKRRAASLTEQIYLSKNQTRILNLLDKRESANSKELVKFLGVTRQAVNKDIRKLMSLGLIKKTGSGPQVRYTKT